MSTKEYILSIAVKSYGYAEVAIQATDAVSAIKKIKDMEDCEIRKRIKLVDMDNSIEWERGWLDDAWCDDDE